MSIVVPVYNVEKYLRECLDSLVNQTLKEIEIIVVNDCSPDNSEAIILEYAAKDPRIVYIKHEVNKCLGGARNTGIRAARGKYIAFVDSDDYVDRCLYEEVVSLFKKSGADVVSCGFKIFETGKPGQVCTYGSHLFSKQQANLDNFLEVGWSACSKIYHLENLKNNQIFFVEHYFWEDILFWFDYCLKIQPCVAFLPLRKSCYRYRKHENSITGLSRYTYNQMPIIFEKMYSLLREKELLFKEVAPFKKIFCLFLLQAWLNLTSDAKKEFIKNFDHFLSCVEFNAREIVIFSEWYLYKKMRTLEEKILFMDLYTEKLRLENGFWQSFGTLSPLGKIMTLCKYFIQRFIQTRR